MKRNRGNQPLTQTQKEEMVRQIEPYLKSGLSVRKACLQSGIPRSTLYQLMEEDTGLADQITQFQNYLSILTMSALTKQIMLIRQKQNQDIKLDWQDIRFLMWFVTHSRHCKEEFGREARKEPAYDPELEITKLSKIFNSEED